MRRQARNAPGTTPIMANLATLPLNAGALFRVVVETPRGSTQKIDYDAANDCFFVKRRLPLGVAYPFHFGFFPSTRGEDGDPVDALVLSGDAAFSGLVLMCRVVGVLKLEQREGGRRFRNDRYIVIPKSDVAHTAIESIRDLDRGRRREIEEFLAASVRLEDKKLTFRGWADRRVAIKALRVTRAA
jgi:inorganic pyrophosphatase